MRLRVVLSDPTGASIRNESSLLWITEDEPVPRLVVGNTRIDEGDHGEREASVDVTLTGKTNFPVTMTWRARGAFSATGEATVAAGDTKTTIAVPYLANTIADGDRHVTIDVVTATDSIQGRSGSLTILDDDSATIAASNVEVDEAHQMAVVAVTLSSAHDVTVSVDYDVWSDHEYVTAGRDYDRVTGMLTFAPGETKKEILVPIHQDAVAENDETVVVSLRNGGSGRALRNGRITIHDDGDFPTLSVDDITVQEGWWWDFLIVATPVPEKPIRVGARLQSGTATIGTDVNPTLEWWDFEGWIPAGWGYAFVLAGVYGDDVVEEDETFTLLVTSAGDSSTVLASAQALIKDTTGLRPRLSVSSASTREGETATFDVTLSKPADDPVSFRVRTVGDTAEAGTDFEPLSNVYTIEPGELTTAIDVKVLEDHVAEQHETFAVELSQPWNAAIGAGVGRGRIFDDDDPEVPVFGMSDVTVSEGAGVARFTVTLARVMSARTSIAFGTRDGTGKAGEDYLASHGELTFEPGETSKTVEIALVNDARFEEDETFTLRLANGFEATATVVNDDAKARSRSVRH